MDYCLLDARVPFPSTHTKKEISKQIKTPPVKEYTILIPKRADWQ